MIQHILVTGGAGYIGSHAVRALLAAGYEVSVVDHLQRGHRELVDERAHFFEVDLGDARRMREVFEECREYSVPVDSVMHFAGRIEAGLSERERDDFYHNNVVCGERLLGLCRDFGIKDFIFSSTAAVYGEPECCLRGEKIAENEPLHPINYYGSTKLEFEMRLRDEMEQEREQFGKAGFRYVALRYFNAAGADSSGKLGEWHTVETHLIPRVLKAAKGELEGVEIYGVDYPTRDGTCVRDYIHVSDLIDAHLLALRYLSDGGASDVFNLGNGEGFTVREVVAAAERVTGVRLDVDECPRREGDPAFLVADSEKARRVLGWKPKHSDIERIITDAWRWERNL